MKKLILSLLLIVLPLLAGETWLGMVAGAEGDALILVDGAKVYVPHLSAGRYYDENDQVLDPSSITFPFTASLVITKGSEKLVMNKHSKELSAVKSIENAFVKIHKFYAIVQGRLVERK